MAMESTWVSNTIAAISRLPITTCPSRAALTRTAELQPHIPMRIPILCTPRSRGLDYPTRAQDTLTASRASYGHITTGCAQSPFARNTTCTIRANSLKITCSQRISMSPISWTMGNAGKPSTACPCEIAGSTSTLLVPRLPLSTIVRKLSTTFDLMHWGSQKKNRQSLETAGSFSSKSTLEHQHPSLGIEGGIRSAVFSVGFCQQSRGVERGENFRSSIHDEVSPLVAIVTTAPHRA